MSECTDRVSRVDVYSVQNLILFGEMLSAGAWLSDVIGVHSCRLMPLSLLLSWELSMEYRRTITVEPASFCELETGVS